MEHEAHSEFPLLSIIFAILSWYTYSMSWFDIKDLDNGYLLPATHLVTICSGTVAVVLGVISIRDKQKKKRKSKF